MEAKGYACGYVRENGEMAEKGIYRRFERMGGFCREVVEKDAKIKNMQEKCEIICVCQKKVVILYDFFGWGSQINQKTKIIREADVGDWSKIIKN